MSSNKKASTTEFVQQVLALDAVTLQNWLANQTAEGRKNVLAHLEAYRAGLEVKRWQLSARGRELAAQRAGAQTTLERLEALHQSIIADLGEQFSKIYQNAQAAVQSIWKFAHENGAEAAQKRLKSNPGSFGNLNGALPFFPTRLEATGAAKRLDFIKLFDLYRHVEVVKAELAKALQEVPHVRH